MQWISNIIEPMDHDGKNKSKIFDQTCFLYGDWRQDRADRYMLSYRIAPTGYANAHAIFNRVFPVFSGWVLLLVEDFGLHSNMRTNFQRILSEKLNFAYSLLMNHRIVPRETAMLLTKLLSPKAYEEFNSLKHE